MGSLLTLFDDAFAVRNLFRGGNAGVFLNFSDANRCQDAAGTTLATADTDPLGLIYDLKNGVPVWSDNLTIANNAIESGTNATTGWTALNADVFESQSSVTGGSAFAFHVNSNTTKLNNALISRVIPAEIAVGDRVEISIRWRHVGVGGAWRLFLGGSAVATCINTETTFKTTTTVLTYSLGASIVIREASTTNDGGVYVDNITIKKLPGSHAYQFTPTARPLLGIVPTYYYAKFDLADDVLNTYLPAITGGTICLITSSGTWFNSITKAAGVLALGPTTYTGGPAGLLDALKNGAADFRLISYIVIDKALSASEKAAIVSWGRARGGQGEVVYP